MGESQAKAGGGGTRACAAWRMWLLALCKLYYCPGGYREAYARCCKGAKAGSRCVRTTGRLMESPDAREPTSGPIALALLDRAQGTTRHGIEASKWNTPSIPVLVCAALPGRLPCQVTAHASVWHAHPVQSSRAACICHWWVPLWYCFLTAGPRFRLSEREQHGAPLLRHLIEIVHFFNDSLCNFCSL